MHLSSSMHRAMMAEMIQNQLLHINSLSGISYSVETIFKLLQGFGRVKCKIRPLPLTLALASNTAY